MRKKINLILGALIALLCGCKSQKDIPMQSDRIMVLYGPPAYFQQQTKQQQETQQQTTPQQEAPQEASQKD